MDLDVARWALEFLIRNCATDTVIKKIISKLPLAEADYRLKKTILLRTVQNDVAKATVDETVLETLELMEELDRSNGTPITPAMCAAYCAVAVECTLKYLELELSPTKNAGYLNAVERIWQVRVRDMEPRASGDGSLLFSAELNRWRGDIEASLSDLKMCERFANIKSRRDALNKLKAYLAEAWENMGPSFLELSAKKGPFSASFTKDKELLSLTGNSVEHIPEVAAAGTSTHDAGVCDLVVLDDHELGGSSTPPRKEREIQKENQMLKRKHTNTSTEEVDPSASCCKNDFLPSCEVQKVRESLKCSSLELQALVKDPLPDALHMSDIVRSEIAMKDMNHEPPLENQSRNADADVSDPNVCKGINNVDRNLNKASSVRQGDVPHPSLMERNSTAHTIEWDDSIDVLPEGTSNHATRVHLPSPKRKNVSPLKKYEPENLAKRRKPRKWSLLEEDVLRSAVQEIGKGNWKLILNSHRDIFEGRTEVDLKDKWRNMTRYGGK